MKYLLTMLVLLGCLSADARADFNGIDLSTMCVSNNQAIRDQCTAWISGFQAGISANDEKSNCWGVVLALFSDNKSPKW